MDTDDTVKRLIIHELHNAQHLFFLSCRKQREREKRLVILANKWCHFMDLMDALWAFSCNWNPFRSANYYLFIACVATRCVGVDSATAVQRQVELHLRQQLAVSVLQGALAPLGASFDDAWVAVWRRAGGAAHRIPLCYGRKLFSCRRSMFFLSCCGPEKRLLIAWELWHACRSGHLRW